MEINSFLLSIGGVTILIDPLLEGPLDFGIPASLYKGTKRVLPKRGLTEKLPPIDCILLTQGLEDHAHLETLTKLSKLYSNDSNMPMIIAPPSARSTLIKSGFDQASHHPIQYIQSGEQVIVKSPQSDNSGGVCIVATSGALVGPPWQARENGYILKGLTGTHTGKTYSSYADAATTTTTTPSIYIEPHVEFQRNELERTRQLLGGVNVVITPTSGQSLPAFELVHGTSAALELVDILQPTFVIPMPNGEINAEGTLSKLVRSVGSAEEFCRRLEEQQRKKRGYKRTSVTNAQVLNVVPGEDMEITI
jgi:hypothetical protein